MNTLNTSIARMVIIQKLQYITGSPPLMGKGFRFYQRIMENDYGFI